MVPIFTTSYIKGGEASSQMEALLGWRKADSFDQNPSKMKMMWERKHIKFLIQN